MNNQKFKQSPRKLNEQETKIKQTTARTGLLHRKPKRNAHFWTCQFKSVHYIL